MDPPEHREGFPHPNFECGVLPPAFTTKDRLGDPLPGAIAVISDAAFEPSVGSILEYGALVAAPKVRTNLACGLVDPK